MAWAWADVALVAPELASLGSPAQAAIIADVTDHVNVAAWGSQERADRASVYLAAHIAHAGGYYGGGASASVGPVTGQTAGPYSLTFAAPTSASTTDYASTRYGQEYERRLRSHVVGRLGLVA